MAVWAAVGADLLHQEMVKQFKEVFNGNKELHFSPIALFF